MRRAPGFVGALGTAPHGVADDAAQGIAQGRNQNNGPEHVWRDLDKTEYGGLGSQRQQGGGYQADQKERAQADPGQSQGYQERIDRTSVVLGKNVSVRVVTGGRRLLKKKKNIEK